MLFVLTPVTLVTKTCHEDLSRKSDLGISFLYLCAQFLLFSGSKLCCCFLFLVKTVDNISRGYVTVFGLVLKG